MIKIGKKFDAHKLKNLSDLVFVLIEKTLFKFQELHHLYLDFYEEMTENEIKLANISKDDNILHIGSGPIPATVILLAKKTKARITGIDNNINSISQSKLLISKYDFSDKVKIIYADARKFPVKDFNIILISQGIKPRNEILGYISKSINSDTKVVFRTTSSINGELSDEDMFLKDIFSINKTVSHKENGLLISILLNKK